MGRSKNLNPIIEMLEREEDLNYLRSHKSIRKHERILERAEYVEEPEIENLHDTGVFIPPTEELSSLQKCYYRGTRFRGYFPKPLI